MPREPTDAIDRAKSEPEQVAASWGRAHNGRRDRDRIHRVFGNGDGNKYAGEFSARSLMAISRSCGYADSDPKRQTRRMEDNLGSEVKAKVQRLETNAKPAARRMVERELSCEGADGNCTSGADEAERRD